MARAIALGLFLAATAICSAAAQTSSLIEPAAPATVMPPPTALDGAQGTATTYARADHTHAARVQRTVITTASDGTFTWAYARPIICPAGKPPPVSYMVEDTGSPAVVQVISRGFKTDATAGTDTHTSVTVKAQRSRAVPALVASLAGTLGYDVFGLPAAGVKVNLWAADPTQ